jgi:large repetitive protein
MARRILLFTILLLCLTVPAAAQFVIGPLNYPDGVVGEPYPVVTPTTQGGVAPITWSILNGSLPPGLSLNSSTGVVFGTPTTAGSFGFTLRATSATGETADRTTGIQVWNIQILPATVPTAVAGSNYSVQFTATGGGAAYGLYPGGGVDGPPPIPGLSWDEGIESLVLAGVPTTPGTYNFTVTYYDDFNVEKTQNYTLEVVSPYQVTPTSLPGGQVAVLYSQQMMINTSNPTDWAIQSGSLPPGLSIDSGTGLISGTPTLAGTYNFVVRAYTSVGEMTIHTDSVPLSIVIAANPVILQTASLPNGVAGTAYSQQLVSTGGLTPYLYSIQAGSLPPGISLTSAGVNAGLISGTTASVGSFTVTIRVTDSLSSFSERTYNFQITSPYVITPTSLPNATQYLEYSQPLALNTTEPASWSIVSGSLPSGVNLNSSTGLISGTPFQAGAFTFTVRAQVSTQFGITPSQDRTLTLNVGDNPLTILTASLPNGFVGQQYSQPVVAAGGAPPYFFNLNGGNLPPGLSLDSSSGVISGAPTTIGSYTFEVQVWDNFENDATRTLSIEILPSLTVTTTNVPGATLNQPYSTTLQHSGTTQPVTWQLTSGTLPPGITLSSAGVLSGTPTQLGTFNFAVRVGLPSIEVFSQPQPLTITVAPPPLTLSPPSLPGGVVSVPYTATFTPGGGVGNFALTLLSGALPPGLNYNPATRTISGTPSTYGSFPFVMRLTSGSDILEQQFTINVEPAPLVFLSESAPDGYRSETYQFNIQVQGGVPPYQFSVSSGGLPPAVALNPGGAVVGQPGGAGVFPFTATVVDSLRASASASFTITIYDQLTLVGPSPLPAAVEGEEYSTTLQVTGGKPPLNFTLLSGALPAGITLSPAGVVSGIATAGGQYVFTARVEDANGRASQRSIELPVVAALRIETETLPEAVTFREYNVAMAASGGVAPYTWTYSGGLPPGLFFENGVFRGAPTAIGEFPLTINVTDSGNRSTARVYTLVVTGGILITTSSLPPAEAGEDYAAQLTAVGGEQPYRWSIEGLLPEGLSLNPGTGLISGRAVAAGTFNFIARVEDINDLSDTATLSITVSIPPPPTVQIMGLPPSTGPAQQPTFTVMVSEPYPAALDGELDLAFAPDSGPDDPAVQFANGSRRLPFRIPATLMSANFGGTPPALQTGTVAGLITLTTSYRSGNQDLTPTPAPTQTIRIAPAAPVLTRLDVTRSAAGFELAVFGFSTPRNITRATVRLTPAQGATLTTTEFNLELGPLFTTWYTSAQSAEFGSQFRLVLPFGLTGSGSDIASVSVTLTNSVGTSNTLTSIF